MSEQLQTQDNGGLEFGSFRNPELAMKEAEMVAAAFRKRAESLQLYKEIGTAKSKHLLIEGWQMLASMYRITASITSTRYVEFGDVNGWEATAEAIHIPTGQVVSRADAICLSDEDNWGPRPKYEWRDDGSGTKKKVQVGTVATPTQQLRSMSQCVPLNTEILTRRGFLRHDEVRVGEDVLAYDCDSDTCRWVPLQNVSVYENESLISLKSRSLDILCNAEHSWAVRRFRTGKRISYQSLLRTIDLPTYSSAFSNAIVCAAMAESGKSVLTPDEAAIIGWMITDGTMRATEYGKVRSHIDQSKAHRVEEIRALVGLNAVSEHVSFPPPRTFPTGRTYELLPSHRFNLRQSFVDGLLERAGISKRADCPALATRLSTGARSAMLSAMLHADAHNLTSGGNRSGNGWLFSKQNPHVVETFQVLAALEGRALGKPQTDKLSPGLVKQSLRVNRHIQLRAIRFAAEENKATVWCPTTELGTWVMRQNNQVMITGNTRACSKVYSNLLKFVARMAGFAGTPAEEMTGHEHDHDEQNAGGRTVNQPQRKDGGPVISEAQGKRLFAISKSSGRPQGQIDAILKSFGFASDKEVSKAKYDAVVAAIQDPNWKPPVQQTDPIGNGKDQPPATGEQKQKSSDDLWADVVKACGGEVKAVNLLAANFSFENWAQVNVSDRVRIASELIDLSKI